MNKKLTKILSLLLGVSAAVCMSFAIVSLSGANGQSVLAAQVVTEDLAAEYGLNTFLTVPETVDLVVDEAGSPVEGKNPILVLPDGVIISDVGGTEYKLDQKGTYTLKYFSDSGEIEGVKNFNVYKEIYEFSSTNSTASYGKLTYPGLKQTSTGVKDSSGKTVIQNTYGNNGYEPEGIRVTLADGDVFRYNVPVNVNDFDIMDVVQAYPRISWGSTSYSDGKEYAAANDKEDTAEEYDSAYVAGCKYILFRIVDCYDSSKYLEFYVWSTGNGGFYLGAGASNQPLTGLEYWGTQTSNRTATINYGTTRYNRHVHTRYSGNYGASSGRGSFSLLTETGGIHFNWDTDTNEVWRLYHKSNSAAVQDRVVVTDFDAPEIYTNYGLETLDWEFTTGEVYFEMEGKYFSSSTIDVELLSIFGRTGEELKNGYCVDTTAPEVTPDLEKTNDGGVAVITGKTLTVPSVSVFDTNYAGDASYSVYYNYGTDGQTDVKVVDGKFTPDKPGTYTVVYTVRDVYGNTTVSTLDYNAVNRAEGISFEQNILTKLNAGEYNEIPDVNATGINKAVNVSVYVIDPSGTKTEIDYSTRTFEPRYTGEYTIHYDMADNVYTAEFEYKVVCVDEKNIVNYYDQYTMPNYFVKGATYTIDDYFAYTMGDTGAVPHVADVYVSVDGGNFAKLTEEQIKHYLVTGNETLTFKYKYNDTESAPVTVDIIDVGYGDGMSYANYGKYFVIDGFDYANLMAAGSNSIAYVFNGTLNTDDDGKKSYVETAETTDSAEIVYANVVSYSNFQMQFSSECPDPNKPSRTVSLDGGFNKVTITLTDYLNSANTVDIIAEQNGLDLLFTVNGITQKISGVSLKTTKGINLLMSGNKLGSGLASYVPVEMPEFEGDRCLVTVKVEDISGVCAFAVKSFMGQTFSNRMRVGETSGSVYETNITGAKSQFDEFTVTKGVFTSPLFPTTYDALAVSVRYMDADGNYVYVTSKDGIKLENVIADRDYQISLDEIVFYYVVYTYTLGNGASYETQIAIMVRDNIKPEVSFADGIDETKEIRVKKNALHAIKPFTYSDNYTAYNDLKVLIFVRNEHWDLITGSSRLHGVYFNETGKYVIGVYVVDEAGNTARAYYNVLVYEEE